MNTMTTAMDMRKVDPNALPPAAINETPIRYTPPIPVGVGDTVLWGTFPGTEDWAPAIVTFRNQDSVISCLVIFDEAIGCQAKDGCRHADDPDQPTEPSEFMGVWKHTDRTEFNHKMLLTLQGKIGRMSQETKGLREEVQGLNEQIEALRVELQVLNTPSEAPPKE